MEVYSGTHITTKVNLAARQVLSFAALRLLRCRDFALQAVQLDGRALEHPRLQMVLLHVVSALMACCLMTLEPLRSPEGCTVYFLEMRTYSVDL